MRSRAVIDPKPYVGDPAYDVLQRMLNDRGQLLADPRGFAAPFDDSRRPRSCTASAVASVVAVVALAGVAATVVVGLRRR